MRNIGRGKQADKGQDERRDARTRRGTRRTRQRSRAGIDSGRVAIGFPHAPFSQAHQYHPSSRPSSRLVVSSGSPGSRLARLPSVSARSPFCRYAPVLVSSSHPVISFAYRLLSSSPSGLAPFTGIGLATTGGGQRGRRRTVFFFRAPFSSAHYRSPRHQALVIGEASPDRSVPRRGGLDGVPSSSHPVHLTHPPLPSSHHGTRGGLGRPSSFKQATASWHSSHHGGPGSSSHRIVISWERLARASRHEAPRPSSRLDIPGSSHGSG